MNSRQTPLRHLNRHKQALELLKTYGGDLQAAIRDLQAINAALQQKIAKSYRPRSQEVVIHVEAVSKTYKMGRNRVEALKDVTLDVYKGEFVAITGTSGSGKSTLLQLMGGLDKPSSGTIKVHGQDLRKLSDRKLSRFRNRTIGFVFQFFYLQPFLRLAANIEVPAMFARSRPKVRSERSKELAGLVGLDDRLRHFPRELSGGQMQRAAIARALQNSPNILLADEPTGNLDHANATAIFKLFKKIRDEQGTTVIVVTHDTALAAQADRSIHMSDGRSVTPQVKFEAPDEIDRGEYAIPDKNASESHAVELSDNGARPEEEQQPAAEAKETSVS